MERVNIDNLIFTTLLHRYVCACESDNRGPIRTGTALTLWRVACNRGLSPASSLANLGFLVEYDKVQPLPEALAKLLERRVASSHHALTTVQVLHALIIDMEPRRLESLLV